MLPNVFTLKFIEPDGDEWYGKGTYYADSSCADSDLPEVVVIQLTKKDNKVFSWKSNFAFMPDVIEHSLKTDSIDGFSFYSKKL